MSGKPLRVCDCGAKPTLWVQKQASLVPGKEESLYFVQCPKCGARTRKPDEFAGVAILHWNRRDLMNKCKERKKGARV